jgi:Tol biopolymer transport system component/DNA-binding winged helix-turn-helix (wHTH) protein
MSGESRPSYEFGPFRLDPSEHMLVRDGQVVPLTPKTFELLRVLVQNSGHLVGKDTLLSEIWPDNFVEEGALNRSISIIRKALRDGVEQKYIETVPKRGYRFIAPVTIRPASPLPSMVDRETDGAEATHAALTHTTSLPIAETTAEVRAVRSLRGAAVIVVLLSVAAISYALLHRTEGLTAPAGVSTVHRQVTFTGKEGTPTLSPDGRRIAYVSNETPEKKVMVQELAGGSPLVIFEAPEAGHLRWSPDGSDLLVWARGAGHNGVYIVPQMGGTPRLVANGMFIGCWSPDGSTIAIPSYLGGKIWFVNREGTRLRTVALRDVAWSIWDIDWSPAAELLMFTSSDEQGRFTLWTVRPDGKEQTPILTESTGIYSARWAPRGDAIYYLRQLNQTDSLYKVRVKPGRATTNVDAIGLLTGLETDQSFALSADGGRLVYARAPYHSNLWLLEVDENARIVTKELTRGTSLIERPHISPDGQSIAFNMGHEPTANIYTMPIAGGPARQLTFFNSFNLAGGWSADGRSIAFASNEGGTPRVWTVSAEGGSLRPLSSGRMSDSFNVTWSPGQAILYQEAGNRNYYQLDPETSTEQPFVTNASVGWMFQPAYSPAGRNVAVMWNRPPNRGVWVVDQVDHQETFVYKTTAAWAAPVGWSADGLAIYAVEGKNLAARGLTSPFGETLTDARIVMIPLKGSPKTVATFPPEEVGGITMTAEGRRFVYAVYSSRSDVWVVDNFDPPSVPRVSWKH